MDEKKKIKIALAHLLEFCEVAKEESFSKAAENLEKTQPAVSSAIRKLEETLGITLFNRHNKRVILTEEGKLLYKRALEIIGLLENTIKGITNGYLCKTGVVRIGAPSVVIDSFLFELINEFRKNNPEIVFSIQEGASIEVVKGIENQSFELGIVGEIKFPPHFIIHKLTNIEFTCIIPNKYHDLFKETNEVSLQDLKDIPFILQGKESALRIRLEELFYKARFRPSIVMEVNGTTYVKRAILDGIGLSFLPIKCVKKELERGEVLALRLKEGKIVVPVFLVYHADYKLSPATYIFKEFLKEKIGKEAKKKIKEG